MKLSIEVHRSFDPALWKSAPLPPKPASTLLVTWTLEPEPIDGGMPPIVQALFSSALCSLGTVYYAGDADAQTVVHRVAEIPVRQGLRRHLLQIYHGKSAAEIQPAFESGMHNWSLNAQWLIVAEPAELEPATLEPLTRTLYQDWQLPIPWPECVLLIVQSGVDGDAAICHLKNPEVAERLCEFLRLATTQRGLTFEAHPIQ